MENILPYLNWVGAILIVVGVGIYLFSKKNNSGSFFAKFATSGNSRQLDMIARDITRDAREGKIDPVIGRGPEIMRVTQILTRRTKNNVILVGPPGVGKTAILEGLALKIATGDVPAVLQNKRVLSLQIAEILAGTKYRGEFEQKIKIVVDEIRRSNRTIILFIDEIHTITQTKGTEGSVNLSDILKPALARGDLQLIGATTQKEYEQYIQPDESWDRRFQCVLVDEPSVDEAIEILKGVKKNYENYHKVHFSDEAIESAVRLSQEYIKGRRLPDKAIDIIDEAAAMVNVQEGAAPDHAVALLYGAANKVSNNNGLTESIKNLKEELQDLKKQEEGTKDVSKLQLIRKQQIQKVKEIEKEEKELLKKEENWPTVDKNHIKEVVAEWVNMEKEEIH